jgi:plasmid rolling circle replication initiator protein Rep
MAADPETREIAAKIGRCVNRIGVALEIPAQGEPTATLQAGRLCGARMCPFCEWRRSQAWRARLNRGLAAFAADHPTHRAIFLTLTVQNCQLTELRRTIGEMHAGWKRLTKLSDFPSAHWLRRTEVTIPRPEDNIANSGQFLSLEGPAADIDKEEDPTERLSIARLADRPHGPAMAHPHIHALVLVPASYFSRGYLRKEQWRQMWQMSARLDYAPIVDVRTAYSPEHNSSDRVPLGAVVSEAAKYIAKAADVVKLGPYAGELHSQLRGLRLIQASSRFSRYVANIEPEDRELLDPLPVPAADSELIAAIAEWHQADERYRFV